MFFVENYHMVKTFSGQGTDDTFGDRILPRTVWSGGVSSRPNRFMWALKSSLKILSLSRMTYLAVSSKAKVSLSC